MNAVEIEEAISNLAESQFDALEFPFLFLSAFGNKETTIKQLRSGSSNKSDLGGILQRNNIHLKVCDIGEVTNTLLELRTSPATVKAKAKFILSTDGVELEAEDLSSGEVIACDYEKFSDHFGFFLPLAGITTVKQIRESAFDIKATGRLNRLYVELLKDNPDWGSAERRQDMNHFMARLIFCFFAEDTDIFNGADQFTGTIDRMSERDSSNTHEIIEEIFRAMNTKPEDRTDLGIARWANVFPYVNGGLFSGNTNVPKFSRIARSYFLHIGNLEWTKINPDIFGSMIQAVADDEERGALGMHYTSVPNILKVLNPLFLDDLCKKLEEAGDNPRKLLNLRNRIAKIRVFDPACGSGNFLVIAYKEMRAIEAEINRLRDEIDRRTDIPITNFRGIELRNFPAEIARLALIIAEYQCDLAYRGQKEALAEFLPLDTQNWITCGNALRLDWLSICPPTGMGVKHQADDLFMSPLDQAQIDFKNEGGETYICGNPPYVGSKKQSTAQKDDLKQIFDGRIKSWKSLDYVSAWFMKAANYSLQTETEVAFVAADGICQGQQVPLLWPEIMKTGNSISFAHTSFWWGNLATNAAVVLVAIIGLSAKSKSEKRIFSTNDAGKTVVKVVDNINGYLVPGPDADVVGFSKPTDDRAQMQFGNHPYYGTSLMVTAEEARKVKSAHPEAEDFLCEAYGSNELIKNLPRACFWIKDQDADLAKTIPPISKAMDRVRAARLNATNDKAAQKLAQKPWRFRDQAEAKEHTIVVPRVSSYNRDYLPCGIISATSIVTSEAFALYDASLWNLAILSSRMHIQWIATVCGKFGPSYRYSNTLGWNTFPLPNLTEKNKEDLKRCAEGILLAREAHFPATIADLYKPEDMPKNLRDAHDRNDETLERIYIGRRFRNDTERLEKLFELYTKMTTQDIKHNPRMKA